MWRNALVLEMMSSLFWVSLLAVSMSGFEVIVGAFEPPKALISAF